MWPAVMDPKDVHIRVPRTWAWGTFQGRRDFADVTKAVDQPDGVLRNGDPFLGGQR